MTDNAALCDPQATTPYSIKWRLSGCSAALSWRKCLFFCWNDVNFPISCWRSFGAVVRRHHQPSAIVIMLDFCCCCCLGREAKNETGCPACRKLFQIYSEAGQFRLRLPVVLEIEKFGKGCMHRQSTIITTEYETNPAISIRRVCNQWRSNLLLVLKRRRRSYLTLARLCRSPRRCLTKTWEWWKLPLFRTDHVLQSKLTCHLIPAMILKRFIPYLSVVMTMTSSSLPHRQRTPAALAAACEFLKIL